MDEHVVNRLKDAMRANGLDGLVATSQENVAYIAGYVVPSQLLGINNRLFAVAMNAAGDCGLVLTSNELTEAQGRSMLEDLRPYDEFADDPIEVVGGLLADLGLSHGRVGLELDAIPARRRDRLQNHLPDISWTDATPALARARMVKSPREIGHLRSVAAAADAAQADAYSSIKSGMTELDLYRLIVDGALGHGVERVVMVQVAAGERSLFSNPTPSSRPLRPGDLVKVDNFYTIGGYLCDTGRSLSIGEPSPTQLDVWRRVQAVRQELLSAIRPGISTRELWSTFTTGFARMDLTPSIRFVGHGLGLNLHEEPFIAAHTDTVLESGMVLALEPVARYGDVKYFVEDNLLVTDDGIENLTPYFGDRLVASEV